MLATLFLFGLVIVISIFAAHIYISYHLSEESERLDEDDSNDSTQYDLSVYYENDNDQISGSSSSDDQEYKQPNQPFGGNKRRVVVSMEVDNLIERIIEQLVDLYIFSWYQPLIQLSMCEDNPSCKQTALAEKSIDQLRLVLKDKIWLLLSSFIDRLYLVNYVQFVAVTLIHRLTKHFQRLKPAPPSISRNVSTQQIIQQGQEAESLTSSIPIMPHLLTSPLPSMSVSSNASSTSSVSSLLLSDSPVQERKHHRRMPSSVSINSEEMLAPIQSSPEPQTSFNKFDQSLQFSLASHLSTTESEQNLLKKLSFFLLDVLLKEANINGSEQEKKSHVLQLLLSELLAVSLKILIDQISGPTYINYQIVRLIKQYIRMQDTKSSTTAHHFSPMPSSLTTSTFSLNELKQCLFEHNFNRIFEILDQCDDVESLKVIRLQIIGEILDAAVINHLNLNENKFSKNLAGSVKSAPGLDHSKGILAQLGLGALGSRSVRDYPQSNSNNNNNNADNEEMMLDAIEGRFNFNANIHTKVKHLRTKDIRRFLNKLRYAKTICEQKIQLQKRLSATMLSHAVVVSADKSVNSPLNRLIEESDSRFSFDISFNSDLVHSFHASEAIESSSMVQSPESSLLIDPVESERTTLGTLSQRFFSHNWKPKKKNIYKFKTIMANDYSRATFKRFLQQSLFNSECRSSRNKFRKDTLICDCSIYLVEMWEAIQTVFERFCTHYSATQMFNDDNGGNTNANSQQQQQQQHSPISNLDKLFSQCYLLILQTVSDARFYYTFSNQFLQLPADILKLLESFLLGDIELEMFRLHFDDFTINQAIAPFTIDNEFIAAECLRKIDLTQFLQVFMLLEKIIFKCLGDEFYPQFLISSEYDQMFQPHTAHRVIDANKLIPSDRWCTLQTGILSERATVEETVQTRFAAQLRSSKPIQKILLAHETIDIGKNRTFLWHSLEFPFFCLLNLQFVCQCRLQFKIYIKHLISNSASAASNSDANGDMTGSGGGGGGGSDLNPFFLEVGHLLNRDIMCYHEMYSQLRSMVATAYCWLHGKFKCLINTLCLEPNCQNQTNSVANSSQTNIAVDNSSSRASHQLNFRLNITAALTNIDHLPLSVQTELQQYWRTQWQCEFSLQQLSECIHYTLGGNLRMMAYLAKLSLHEYLHVLSAMVENVQTIPLISSHCLEVANVENIDVKHKNPTTTTTTTTNLVYWEKLTKQLNHCHYSIKRLFRHELRDLQKRTKSKVKPQFFDKLSFKKLLDQESDQSTDVTNSRQSIGQRKELVVHSSEQSTSINYRATAAAPAPAASLADSSSSSASSLSSQYFSANLVHIEHLTNSMFELMTQDVNIVKANGFINLVCFEPKRSFRLSLSGTPYPHGTSTKSESCLRCLLLEHLADSKVTDLNGFIMQSLCMIAYRSGLDPASLISSEKVASASSVESKPKQKKLLEVLQLPGQLFQNNTVLPSITGLNQSGQLLFLHARSLLSERQANQIVDYGLAVFRNFGAFCPTCFARLTTTGQMSDLTFRHVSQRKRSTKAKFRLFNLEPSQLMASSSGDVTTNNVPNNELASVHKSSTDLSSCTSSSMLNDNLASSLFDDFSIEQISLLTGLEDFESNLIEPLFQLLIEVFDLKGTMIRTLRRTLMFGFRLVFGQTMFSKQIKITLQSIFADANIRYWLSLLHLQLQSLNEQRLHEYEPVQQQQQQTTSTTTQTNMSNSDTVVNDDNQDSNSSRGVDHHHHSSLSGGSVLGENRCRTESNYFTELDELLNSIEFLTEDLKSDAEMYNKSSGSSSSSSSGRSSNRQSPQKTTNETTKNVIATTTTKRRNDKNRVENNNLLDSPKSTTSSRTSSTQPSLPEIITIGLDGTTKKRHQNDSKPPPPPSSQADKLQEAKFRRLQILAKQLLFASVPTFMSHLFGQEDTLAGLSKCFDILQNQHLNKQLLYEFIEAFLLEYYPEFKRI